MRTYKYLQPWRYVDASVLRLEITVYGLANRDDESAKVEDTTDAAFEALLLLPFLLKLRNCSLRRDPSSSRMREQQHLLFLHFDQLFQHIRHNLGIIVALGVPIRRRLEIESWVCNVTNIELGKISGRKLRAMRFKVMSFEAH